MVFVLIVSLSTPIYFFSGKKQILYVSTNCIFCLSFFYLQHFFFLLFSFFHLTYSRWTSSLPSCLWSQRIFPSLPGSRLTIFFYRDASSALLQLVNRWLNFTYSRSHAFRYERKNTNPTLVRIELTTSVLAVCVFSSHSFWTSSSLDVPARVTQEEGHTGFLIHLLYAVRALVFLARRIQPFLSLVDREVDFCVLAI